LLRRARNDSLSLQADGVLVRPPGAFLIGAEKLVPFGLLSEVECCVERGDTSFWKIDGHSM
jgi:hypothetical protein